MPSYDDLNNEDAWRDEFAAPALETLAALLRLHYPGCGVWLRGDNEHTRGYHRSRRWIKESIYCTNRTYSVSRTVGDRSGGNENWSCALDFGNLPQAELHAVCQRLDAAVRAGRLEKITEWYGNFGGDLRVDGYDNISNQLASADSSHLTHLHMSFDRGRANEDHSDVFAILTGDDMSVLDHNTAWRLQEIIAGKETIEVPADASVGATGFTETNHPQVQLNQLSADVAELKARPQAEVEVDYVKLAAALRPIVAQESEAAVRKVLGTLDGATPA